MKKAGLILLIGCLMCISIAAVSSKENEQQINYVPNEATAIKVAEAVWLGMWEEKVVNQNKPFHATLEAGVWHVSGTKPAAATKGGTIHMKLQANDCKVLEVWGEK